MSAVEPPGPEAQAVIARDRRATSPSLPRAYPFVPRSGSGSVVEDVDGNLFRDMNAGIAVNSTGHSHPAVVAAIQKQAAELIHYSASDFFLPIFSEVCKRLDDILLHAKGLTPEEAQMAAKVGLIAAWTKCGGGCWLIPATPPSRSRKSQATKTAGKVA